jgi:hypothetical protein
MIYGEKQSGIFLSQNIAKIQKFLDFLSLLEGESANLISGLAGYNYGIALTILNRGEIVESSCYNYYSIHFLSHLFTT